MKRYEKFLDFVCGSIWILLVTFVLAAFYVIGNPTTL